MPKGAVVRGLLTVKKDCEFALLLRRGEGGADSIHLYGPSVVDGRPELRQMEVGPFDTGLDVAAWLLRQMIECGALAKM
jgi:hypothetical protein